MRVSVLNREMRWEFMSNRKESWWRVVLGGEMEDCEGVWGLCTCEDGGGGDGVEYEQRR